MNPANFELYSRSIVLAAISVAIVAAALYQVIEQGKTDPTILGWAAAIVGFYLGQHVTTNGARSARTSVEAGAAIEASATEAAKHP